MEVQEVGPNEERVVIKREEEEDTNSEETNSVYENLKDYEEREWKRDFPEV